MAEGVMFNLAEAIINDLGNRAIDEIASAWGFEAELEKLKNTMNTINNMLLDAEERQLESHTLRGWLERLKAAVYAADDLFDEFATVASRQELLEGNKLTKKVQVFFSRSNQIAIAFSISRKIKKIREDLDDIVKDGNEFSFVQRPYEERGLLLHRVQREQTYSYVDSDEIVGRDDDKKAILDILLASTNQKHLSIVPIVGIGGMGKTTLAQLIYTDEEVEKHFELKLWVCVSESFDIKEIIKKILLMSATNAETQKLEMDQLQSQLRKEVGGKKYLLVLDDVWNEDREQWLKLKALLKTGREGSKIVVTTRSMGVAKIMGTDPSHELKGLSEKNSWVLFEKMAFEPGEAQKKLNLVKVGKEIVKKCADVPLAIRTLGSLLYGKDESKWLSFREKSLAKISENGNNIMSILKLSYHQLWSPLKNCFGYCALFPKDYELEKETLINLWMAEGFLVPMESQSPEEVGEEYFLTLLHRCFFQDVTKDEWGNIRGCKMHDLMHDLAQEVAGIETAVALCGEMKLDKRIRRLSFGYCLNSMQKIQSCVLNLELLRTFLLPEQRYDGSGFSRTICHQLLSKIKCLRVLDLHGLGVKTLPSSIGRLIHLRYLNLSLTPIRALPDSITSLRNLQTLNLYPCYSLRRLPTDIRKLTNLRSLDVGENGPLTHMPSGMGALTSLHKLTSLIVNLRDPPALSRKHATAQLRDLKNLNNLRGVLRIDIRGNLKDPIFEAKEADLSSKHGLTELHIEGDGTMYEELNIIKHDDAVLEGLKPHPNLKKLTIYWYKVQNLPSWAMRDNLSTSLPNLVEIKLLRCGNCQQLPAFSQLRFLKRLGLICLQRVEYLENSVSRHSPSPGETLFFPSLQELTLMSMDSLKAWWRDVGAVVRDNEKDVPVPLLKHHSLEKSFTKLSKLRIDDCLNLTSIPLCPNVEELTLVKVNEDLSVLKMATSSRSEPSRGSRSKLKILCLDNVEELISLPQDCLHDLSSLDIQHSKLVSTSTLGEVFKSLSSLRSLNFTHCKSLGSISRGLENLTALENMRIWCCKELDLSPNEEPQNDMPWKAITSLRSLQIQGVKKFVALPNGLQHLTNLRSLKLTCNYELTELPTWISCFTSLEFMELYTCPKLKCLPDGFRELTSLQELEIDECPGLTKRCRGPIGADWPKIKHIPHVTIRKSYLD